MGCVVPGRSVQIHCRRGLQPPKYPSEAGWAGRGRTAEECQGRVWNVCNSVKSVGALPAPTDVWASRLGGRTDKWSLPALLLLESLPTIPALPKFPNNTCPSSLWHESIKKSPSCIHHVFFK